MLYCTHAFWKHRFKANKLNGTRSLFRDEIIFRHGDNISPPCGSRKLVGSVERISKSTNRESTVNYKLLQRANVSTELPLPWWNRDVKPAKHQTYRYFISLLVKFLQSEVYTVKDMQTEDTANPFSSYSLTATWTFQLSHTPSPFSVWL